MDHMKRFVKVSIKRFEGVYKKRSQEVSVKTF